jgi:DNA-binding PadR family transcriptional regulator
MKKKPGQGKVASAPAPRKTAPKRIKASLELALLGLIAEQHEASGYDLVQLFRLSMVHYWHAHPGQIYPTLERMERDGWIAGREIVQRGRPNKRVYSITPQGRATLIEWLQSPYEPFKMKSPPLLRSRFLGYLGADGAREKFLEARAAMATYLELLRGYDKAFADRGGAYGDVNTMFVYFTLNRGIQFAQQEMAFCDWAISEIERHRALFEGVKTAPPEAAPRAEAKATGRDRSL